MTCVAYENPIFKALKPIWIWASNQEPALELHSRAAPSVEAHHLVNSPVTGKNFGGRRIKKIVPVFLSLSYFSNQNLNLTVFLCFTWSNVLPPLSTEVAFPPTLLLLPPPPPPLRSLSLTLRTQNLYKVSFTWKKRNVGELGFSIMREVGNVF